MCWWQVHARQRLMAQHHAWGAMLKSCLSDVLTQLLLLHLAAVLAQAA